MTRFLFVSALLLSFDSVSADSPRQISGIYPSLAMFNEEGECGTGAVVPWADRLWVITYGPHLPKGSSDKLYEITPDLRQIIRPESIGGTPANRMIHGESQQLFIGPYAIDSKGGVKAIPYSKMFGRHTGLARHLTDPAGKIVFATMEEGINEVDVNTLAVTNLWVDEQLTRGGANKKSITENLDGRAADLPGYHGKGFYSSQGRYIYANNGEYGREAQTDPTTPSGVLAEWDGKADKWTVVRRNQFTEVTGPGGIHGGKPTDPVWSMGWDHRSLILMMLDGGKWHTFRLPKASNSYDGAHGWNTEWPRIREIGDGPLLMTMHGMFWEFPKTFSTTNTAGIRPISSYIKVIGDFCEWQGNLVFGCDDSAKSEFLNKRKAKGTIAAPQSQSNLWFMKRETLPQLGPTLSQGAVWLNDEVKAGEASDPFLSQPDSSLFLKKDGASETQVDLEVSENATTSGWVRHQTLTISGTGQWLSLGQLAQTHPGASWVRLRPSTAISKATALFTSGKPRSAQDALRRELFAGFSESPALAATVRARGENKGTLHYMPSDGKTLYELNAKLELQRVEDADALAFHQQNCTIASGMLTSDAASLIYTDDAGRRWRLPKGSLALETATDAGPARLCREVCTERDLFNAGGTFYELPAENAGGFAKVRPICTHNRRIHDYCSWRGLLILTGVSADASTSEHIIRSGDGQAAVWAGVVDDLWSLPAPTGTGGPWKDTEVTAHQPSDPCLIWGFAKRQLTLSHKADRPVNFSVELDLMGDGHWIEWKSVRVKAGESVTETLPAEVQARWLRLNSDTSSTVTAVLVH